MLKEEKQIKGEIQAVRKDGKSIEIENIWYNFFKPCFDFKKGDNVSITYTDNVNFHNIKSIKKLENIKTETKIDSKISDTTINCLLMQSVQYSKDKNIQLIQATEEIIQSYKKIIKEIKNVL